MAEEPKWETGIVRWKTPRLAAEKITQAAITKTEVSIALAWSVPGESVSRAEKIILA